MVMSDIGTRFVQTLESAVELAEREGAAARREEARGKRRARRAARRAMYEANAPRVSKYGASLGRSSFGRLRALVSKSYPDVHETIEAWPEGTYLVAERVRGCDGGDYDRCGAYWGNLCGNPLYWVAAVFEGEVLSETFLRVGTAKEARERVLARYPDLGVRFRAPRAKAEPLPATDWFGDDVDPYTGER